VSGRIDHFAVDPGRQRLFVAELGNNSVGVIDLKQPKVLRTIGGLKDPHGVAYVSESDTLYVANAGDGSVHLFQARPLQSGVSNSATTQTTSELIRRPTRYSWAMAAARSR